jgi:16S rRNA (guanine527-N7)-methyltransferase
MMDPGDAVPESLNDVLRSIGLLEVQASEESRFKAYLDLLLKWNGRMNLTAVRDPGQILRTHFAECIFCARALPSGIQSLLDFGSGAGFPGIPIAICRPEISVTLAESQGKKNAFLQEAVRTIGLNTAVFTRRAELIEAKFDCVTLRAVDQINEAMRSAARLLVPGGMIALMTTSIAFEAAKQSAHEFVAWQQLLSIPGTEQKILVFGFTGSKA